MSAPGRQKLQGPEGTPCPLTVLLPARDEEATIAQVIRQVQEELQRLALPAYEILVVDDGSRDGTREQALKAGARVVAGSTRGGYGAAIKRGLAQAQGEVILLLDADGTYSSQALGSLLQEIEKGADQAIAARPFMGASGSALRKGVKKIIHKLASILAGAQVVDLNSGMRALRKTQMQALAPLLPDGFSLTTSLTMAGLLSGWQVSWVPVTYQPRKAGSKFRPVRDTLRLLAALGRSLVYFAPLRLFGPLAAFLALLGVGFASWDVAVEHNLGDKTVLTLLTSLELLMLGLLADFLVRRGRQF